MMLAEIMCIIVIFKILVVVVIVQCQLAVQSGTRKLEDSTMFGLHSNECRSA